MSNILRSFVSELFGFHGKLKIEAVAQYFMFALLFVLPKFILKDELQWVEKNGLSFTLSIGQILFYSIAAIWFLIAVGYAIARTRTGILQMDEELYFDTSDLTLRLRIWCNGNGTKKASVKAIAIFKKDGERVKHVLQTPVELEWNGYVKFEKPTLRPNRKTESVSVLRTVPQRNFCICGTAEEDYIGEHMRSDDYEDYLIELEIDDLDERFPPIRKKFRFKAVANSNYIGVRSYEYVVPQDNIY